MATSVVYKQFHFLTMFPEHVMKIVTKKKNIDRKPSIFSLPVELSHVRIITFVSLQKVLQDTLHFREQLPG